MNEETKLTTEEFSILGTSGTDYDSAESEAFHQDLNILQVMDKLAAKWGRPVRRFFLYMPETREEEAFRRAVYGDVKKEAVYDALFSYTKNLAGVDSLRAEKEKVTDPMQKAVWRLREEDAYCNTYEELERALSAADLTSDGMQQFLLVLREYLGSDSYRGMREQTAKILGEIRGLRFIITYDKDRISVTPGEIPGEGAYEEWLDGFAGGERTELQNPFFSQVSVSELERACIEMLKKKKPDFFRGLSEFAEHDGDYQAPVLKRFEQEVLFYLSYCTLQRDLERAGFAFATPGTDDTKRMEAKGLYDLALAVTSLADGRKVVANDFRYDEGERFFVLTGPNQGGKTTFARSLGQLVYICKMGLDVPAESANVPFFPGLQSHFSVEESVQSGRGKLMEELTRLAPMMRDRKRGSFVVINELFTTAANYDAQIMGKRVLEHFIKLGCMGIYVTHLKELADDRSGVVSLRAMLDENGIQTFEIRRGAAEDIACAANQVNKYRLTYEQLKERL